LAREEMCRVYGQDLVDTYEFVNHDCKARDLVPVGSLRSGTVVKINRRVSEADFRIGIGSIFPHPMNGFGGGGKILFPGVAGFDAILEHHLQYSFREASKLGQLQGNPFYEEVCELAQAAGLDFIINSVLDHNDRLYQPVCGAPVEAHLAGVDMSRRILSMPFPKKSDVTIISAFPYAEGTQIMKPLAPATEITREGGVVILTCDYSVPLAESYLAGCERFRSAHAGHIRAAVLELFGRNERILPDDAPELNMSLAQALLGQHDFRIIVVSREMPRKTAERLGFAFAETIEQGIAMGQERCPTAQVHVVPSGGVILPVLPGTATT
jgi:nickel-dependent lactate racemase